MWKWLTGKKKVKVKVADYDRCKPLTRRTTKAQVLGQQQEIVRAVARGRNTIAKLETTTKLDARILRNRLRQLTEMGRLQRINQGRNTYYVVVKQIDMKKC